MEPRKEILTRPEDVFKGLVRIVSSLEKGGVAEVEIPYVSGKIPDIQNMVLGLAESGYPTTITCPDVESEKPIVYIKRKS